MLSLTQEKMRSPDCHFFNFPSLFFTLRHVSKLTLLNPSFSVCTYSIYFMYLFFFLSNILIYSPINFASSFYYLTLDHTQYPLEVPNLSILSFRATTTM